MKRSDSRDGGDQVLTWSGVDGLGAVAGDQGP